MRFLPPLTPHIHLISFSKTVNNSEQLCQQLWTTEAGSENLQGTYGRHLNLNGKFLKKGMEKGTHSQKNSIPLVGKMLASLTPLRPSQVKARCSVWKSQVSEGLPLPYPVFICSHLTGVEGLWGSVVPEGNRPSALPKLWIQIRRHYNVRARQLLVGNPDANNSAGEHLGPQLPGTHPRLCLPQALPSLPTTGSAAAPSDSGKGRGALLVRLLTSTGGPAHWPYHREARPGQRYPDPGPSCPRLCSKIWGSLYLLSFLLNAFSQSENIYYYNEITNDYKNAVMWASFNQKRVMLHFIF